LQFKDQSDRLLSVFDYAGTFVFAAEGALAGIGARLDLFGLMVLSFVTALGGGIIRDVLLGATPPVAIRNWRYPAVAFAAGTLVFISNQFARQIPSDLTTTLDAAGLALFAIAGTEKALLADLSPFVAALLGTVTGAGGGVVRDMLLAQVPSVLRADVYATAAFAGALVMVLGRALGWPRALAAVSGFVVCFLLRMTSVWLHWHLPIPGGA
jgi:uncharacterized membrane protein YeiH